VLLVSDNTNPENELRLGYVGLKDSFNKYVKLIRFSYLLCGYAGNEKQES